jgi:sporulation protein YlmC with PRC-barrel domain
MDIPIGADVECSDGGIGRLTNIILNPATQTVTHVVVKERDFPGLERLVPEESINRSTRDTVYLSMDKKKFGELEDFVQTEFLSSEVPAFMADPYLMWPMDTWVPPILEHKMIPVGELAFRKGAKVSASDGHVGQVDEFLVEKESGHITHLVLREGHLWGKKNVYVPVDQIERYEGKVVYLKMDKKSVEDLPVIEKDKSGEE